MGEKVLGWTVAVLAEHGIVGLSASDVSRPCADVAPLGAAVSVGLRARLTALLISEGLLDPAFGTVAVSRTHHSRDCATDCLAPDLGHGLVAPLRAHGLATLGDVIDLAQGHGTDLTSVPGIGDQNQQQIRDLLREWGFLPRPPEPPGQDDASASVIERLDRIEQHLADLVAASRKE
ncbi:hypothetical protein LO762_29365 [Actinocorallia sp. API 0066]|uniref:hypothetical protein n=1 Tax=Actinocorallia sp. API 0066 TaxID=2896846 RepID=UPI001E553B93|nr:hypothetical protein [Actinocorallia sp. API 0066]MCD0453260.1 hypothetical protein [Actinocorallia sp. API 0066]